MAKKNDLEEMRYAFPPEGSREKLLTGIQALVAAPILMSIHDRAMGRNTAGFISGYRGSPLAGLDKEFDRTKERLLAAHVRFHFGMNEDFAATSLYGTQMLHLFPKPKYDGVFGMWYGKGPGVDRTGDVFKHANAAGTAPLGGVLAVAGDDHTCKSSTMPHQSDQYFRAMRMPYLVPSDVGDILRLSVRGWELSRRAGSWVGFIVVADLADASQNVIVETYPEIVVPQMLLPDGGLNIRWPDDPLEQESRIYRYRLEMAKEFVIANKVNVMTHDASRPRLGIVASGKSYRDTLEAFSLLGFSSERLRDLGIRVMKIGMPWPLSIESMRGFLDGLSRVLVIEEKQNVIEDQMKSSLYQSAFRGNSQPTIVGKTTAWGTRYLHEFGELTPSEIAVAISDQLPHELRSEETLLRVARLRGLIEAGERNASPITLERSPYYCSGCPHNTSTRVIDGSVAGAGIGCHYMAVKMDPKVRGETIGVTPMGQEGTQFIGMKDFTETEHFFQNLGDGTYHHSGSLAIRAAVSANVPMTFKILYNDAVAMTGGQKLDGTLTVPQITHQVYWEGVRRIAVVSDDIAKHKRSVSAFAPGTTFHARDDMEALQRELREWKGVSVLVYDQTCAAEKRRRRKAKTLIDPPTRSFINERVCEGCGDCSVQSNCLSIEPIPTEYGVKRAINQSSCNKDYSCMKGFCPSFVAVDAPLLKKGEGAQDGLLSDLVSAVPEPKFAESDGVANILIAGIGGTGIVTMAQVITMAAYLDGCEEVLGLDITGMSQKAGYVSSHVRLARKGSRIGSAKIPYGETSLLLAADIVSAVDRETLALLPEKGGRGVAVVANDHFTPTAEFIHKPDLKFPKKEMENELRLRAGTSPVSFIDATFYAERLFGDAIASNIFLLGFAYQQGLVPISGAKIEEAVELNGQQVEMNLRAFRVGRFAGHDTARFVEVCAEKPRVRAERSLDEIILDRSRELVCYQDEAYAARYRHLVKLVGEVEQGKVGSNTLTRAVAENYYKLLAYKDEYEVARLYTDGTFERALRETFASHKNVRFELAPPLFAKKDPVTGLPRKSTYGPWIWRVMRLLAKMKFLRGTPFDPFGYTADRKEERTLIAEYEKLVDKVLAGVTSENHATALEILRIPESIRGYGHVKGRSIEVAREKVAALLSTFSGDRRKLREIPVKVKNK